ncbi:MAG: hypothetical protein U9N73_05645, partial [Candidatus Auribacterota bacterium]|nr:hypothetical protein [Candidatus Auribacterota bacterium]
PSLKPRIKFGMQALWRTKVDRRCIPICGVDIDDLMFQVGNDHHLVQSLHREEDSGERIRLNSRG